MSGGPLLLRDRLRPVFFDLALAQRISPSRSQKFNARLFQSFTSHTPVRARTADSDRAIHTLYRNLHLRAKRPFSQSRTKPDANPSPPPPPPAPPAPNSLTQRLRTLSREYGWSALGVYFALSALDFPFCFLAVRIIGTDRIGYAEQVVMSAFWRTIHWVAPGRFEGVERRVADAKEEARAGKETEPQDGWGVEAAEKANSEENASLWTQLALAYAIHKSFIFIRVPLTAAVLPKVVKTLRGWGYNIGKRTPKAVTPGSAGVAPGGDMTKGL